MVPHLSEDTKNRIVPSVEAGNKPRKVSDMFGVSLSTVYELVKKSKTCKEGVGRKEDSGSHNKIRTPEFLAKVRAKVSENPRTSTRRLSREFGVSNPTMMETLKDLDLKSHAQSVAHLITPRQRERRIERIQML